LRLNWDAFLVYVKERKAWMAHSLRSSSFMREDGGNHLVLEFDDGADCKVLQEPDNVRLLTEFAQDFFQKELRVTITARDSGSKAAEETEKHRPQKERRSLASDPLVQMVVEVFEGKVTEIRTGPQSR